MTLCLFSITLLFTNLLTGFGPTFDLCIFREKQLSETETNLADCRTQCKQRADEIEAHLLSISKLNGQIEKLKTTHRQETEDLNEVIQEKLSVINKLEQEVEKCKESISCKSLEIAKLNDSNEERNKTIKSLEASINQLQLDIENLKKQHSAEIDNKADVPVKLLD